MGEHVTHVKEGDHVVLGFTYCGECKNCLDGNAGACENFVALNLLGRNQKNETPLHTEDGEDISQFLDNLHSVIMLLQMKRILSK